VSGLQVTYIIDLWRQ